MDYGPKQENVEPTNQLPDLNLPPHSPVATPSNHKGLAIVLIVAAIFLLAAAGIATWLFIQKSGGNSVITQLDPNSTANVKSVSWVEPQMPEGYEKYNQSTNQATVVYYPNTTDGCSVTTRVLSSVGASDATEVAIQANDSEGIEAKAAAGDLAAVIKDSDGQRQYDFEGSEFDQDVAVQSVDYKIQSGAVYYKKFGNNLAAISFVCKEATFESNAEDLTALIKQFTVKTER